jgi:hypothetical protein
MMSMEGRRISYVTRGFMELPEAEQLSAIREFEALSKERDDWLYSLRDGRVYTQENEEGSYTLMLSEEY